MTELFTVLLLLAFAAWVAWIWYGRYWWAARKWEDEQREAKARLRREARKARHYQEAKEAADRYKAATIQHRAEELKRIRDGENLIYDDMRDGDEAIDLRRLANRTRTNGTTWLS